MDKILHRVLARFVRSGTLKVTTAGGHTFRLGDGSGTPVAIRFTSAAAQRRVLIDPDLRLGEAYVEGALRVEEGSIYDFLALINSQECSLERPSWMRLTCLARYIKRRLQQFNGRARARRNVAHHYDLDGRLYGLFLDEDRQYSCAYFERHDQSLDEAQLAKKRHIAAKLLVRPGTEVLDIGSGWGGLALYLSEFCGARTTGITLSEEQLAMSRMRASGRGPDGKASFVLQDYRDVGDTFDRIVSVGMFEHVGVNHYGAFFRKCSELLADDGIMLLHSIGRCGPPDITNPWIAKYIFPGGYIPALSEVLPAIERAGLMVADAEILRLHYAETLRHWRERFLARRREAKRLYDEKFVRLWEFYLACSELAFRKQWMMVFQLQIVKRQGVVPLTRDYIAQEEARLRNIDAKGRPALGIAAE